MAALRHLLNRGLLAACRRVATAPPRAPCSFSTTTGVPQYHQSRVGSSHLGIKNDANLQGILESKPFVFPRHVPPDFGVHLRWLRRFSAAAAAILVYVRFKCLPSPVTPYLPDLPRSSKSHSQETE